MCSNAKVVDKRYIKQDTKHYPFIKNQVRRKFFQKDALSSTRDMKSFPLSHSQLVDFISYLQTINGGSRSESTAQLIAKDTSKYLYYAKKKNWTFLISLISLSL